MEMTEKVIKSIDHTRGNGNTTVLLGLSMCNPRVKVVVADASTKSILQGYAPDAHIICLGEEKEEDILVFDNGAIYEMLGQ